MLAVRSNLGLVDPMLDVGRFFGQVLIAAGVASGVIWLVSGLVI